MMSPDADEPEAVDPAAGLVNPRLSDVFGLVIRQDEVDFVVPHLREDLPLCLVALRPYHQHLVNGRQGRTGEPVALLRNQIRLHQAHPVAGQRGGVLQHRGQRGMPARGADAAVGRPGRRHPAATGRGARLGGVRQRHPAGRPQSQKTSGTLAPTSLPTRPPTSPPRRSTFAASANAPMATRMRGSGKGWPEQQGAVDSWPTSPVRSSPGAFANAVAHNGGSSVT
jgi:hypothetical protein